MDGALDVTIVTPPDYAGVEGLGGNAGRTHSYFFHTWLATLEPSAKWTTRQ